MPQTAISGINGAEEEEAEGTLQSECIEVRVGQSWGTYEDPTSRVANGKFWVVQNGYRCPPWVDKHVWTTNATFDDLFEVSQVGTSIKISRADRDEGWAMDLRFRCCKNDGDDERERDERPGDDDISGNSGGIPRILHQMAPDDQSKWPKPWGVCHRTWQTLYPNWQYRLWTDAAMREFMATEYPSYLEMYDGFSKHIMRVDAARYFILYHYGGLYADMDYFAYRRLDLPQDGRVVLVQSSSSNEIVQNSLMASPPQHPFWPLTFNLMAEAWNADIKDVDDFPGQVVVSTTGPIMLSQAYEEDPLQVALLDQRIYNPRPQDNCEHNTCASRHAYTGCWAETEYCKGHNSEQMNLESSEAALTASSK